MSTRSFPPELRRLQRVIPVARTEERSDWTITCIAVEVYDDGFRVTFRVRGGSSRSGLPELSPRILDSNGASYNSWGGGGNGERAVAGFDWRMSANCAPTPHSDINHIDITVDQVQLMGWDPNRQQLTPGTTWSGPVVFRVAFQ